MDDCCICGTRIYDGERKFKLSRNYPEDFLCEDCVSCLKEAKTYAFAGSSLYKSARREIVGKLNRGRASGNAIDYCESYLTKLNTKYQEVCAIQVPAGQGDDIPSRQRNAAQPYDNVDARDNPYYRRGVQDDRSAAVHSTSVDRTARFTTPYDLPYQSDARTTREEKRYAVPDVPNSCAEPQGIVYPEHSVPQEQIVVCMNCGAENIANSQFCEGCGAQIQPTRYCRFCGGKLSPITGYCETCSRNRDGETQRQQTAMSAVMRKTAENIGQALSKPAVGGQPNSQPNRLPFLAAGLALVLGLMMLGKMITVPALSWLIGDKASFSLFQIAELSGNIGSLSSFSGSGNEGNGLKAAGIFIAIIAIALLVYFACLVIMGLMRKSSVFHGLRIASALMFCTLLCVVLALLLFRSKAMDLLDDAIKPTALLIISIVCSGGASFYLSKELEYRYAVSMQQAGQYETAQKLFLDLNGFRDSRMMLGDVSPLLSSDE